MPECNLWNSRKKRVARNGISRRNRPNLDIMSNSVQNVTVDLITNRPNRESGAALREKIERRRSEFFFKKIWQEKNAA